MTKVQWRHIEFCLGVGGGGANISTICKILGANLVFILIEIPNIWGGGLKPRPPHSPPRVTPLLRFTLSLD